MRKKYTYQRAILIAGLFILSLNVGAGAGGADETAAAQLLRIDGAEMTANLNAVSLAEVARLLKRNANVTTHFASSEVRSLVISKQFEGKTVADGLRKIFADTDYAMVRLDGSEDRRYQVYVFSQRSGRADTAMLPDTDTVHADEAPERGIDDAHTEDDGLDADLPVPLTDEHPDAERRIAALRLAAAVDGEKAMGQVLAAANDPDPAVRAAYQELMLEDLRQAAPIADLTRLASQSEQAEVRLRALDALSERAHESPYARMAIDGARYDEDPQVRVRAEALAADWAPTDSYISPALPASESKR